MSHPRIRLTDRLRLEPLAVGHTDDRLALFPDPAVAEWYGPWTREQVAREAARSMRSWSIDGVGKWMAYHRATNALVGRGGLSRQQVDGVERLELGRALHRRFWGHGYATEIGRLLFAMARDRQLPAFLSRVSARRSVPVNAVLLTAAVSLGLGLYMASRANGITELASLVNFGALLAFTMLQVAVIVWWARHRRGSVVRHVIVPVIAIVVLVAIMINANVLAQTVGLIWLAIGVLVLVLLYVVGRRPRLSGLETAEDELEGAAT